MSDSDCESLENAVCINHFCQCNGSKFCEEKLQTKVTKLGENCKIEADCNIKHSVCEDGKCKCEDGRVGSTDVRTCLKVADGLGSDCEDRVQCFTKIPHTICKNEKCACQEKTHQFNGTCFEDIALGQKCNHPGECTITPFAKCMDGECICKEGYVPNSAATKCLEIANRINDPCYEDIQCITKFGPAICKQGFCMCEDMYKFKLAKGICIRDILLDEACQFNTDCKSIDQESRLECILGKCKCRSEYVEKLGSCTSSAAYILEHTMLVIFLSIMHIHVFQ
ncbi:unnamed protein product [Ceutorhynchus assimilis]|uniref:EB domain-containing protein n=1 Tax=Ceutorhynchus assimilis TaxID=467358 RepID=A0A9P0DGM9_9CUCU|nr:unnamed protein product [Ceutorhynchus assimilis]